MSCRTPDISTTVAGGANSATQAASRSAVDVTVNDLTSGLKSTQAVDLGGRASSLEIRHLA
jgi:hypothetical protein